MRKTLIYSFIIILFAFVGLLGYGVGMLVNWLTGRRESNPYVYVDPDGIEHDENSYS
jgi:hypothetical protein